MNTWGGSRSRILAAGVAYGAAATLIWGAWPVLSRLGLRGALDAYDIAALRFVVAGLVLLPIVWRRGARGVGWWRAVALACGAGIPYVLLAVGGLAYAPAAHAGVITPSAMLVASTLGSRFVLGDRIGWQRAFGVALAVVGVGAIAWSGFAASGERVWLGDLMFVAAGCLWASYTLGSKAWSVDAMHAAALVAVISMLAYLPIYSTFDHASLKHAPLADILWQALFQGAVASIVALFCYTRSVALLGAARGAVFAAPVPAIAVLLAIPLLGELPTVSEWIGIGLVLPAMACALGIVPKMRFEIDRAALMRRLDSVAGGMLEFEGCVAFPPSPTSGRPALRVRRELARLEERDRRRERVRREAEPVGA